MSNSKALLDVTDIHVRYGNLPALRGASLVVAEGESVGIIGPNGAGKSTILATIAGGVRPLAGEIRLAGTNIRGLRPERIAKMGLSLVPEGRHIFSSLTVRENLLVGAYMRKGDTSAVAEIEKALEYFPALRTRIDYPASRLSGGEQQMLALGRALVTKPRIILIDEPSLGLAPRLIDQIYDILRELRRSAGLTLLINEQSSHRILKHVDRIYVLRSGEMQLDGAAADLRDGTAIRRAYFGFGSAKQAVPGR